MRWLAWPGGQSTGRDCGGLALPSTGQTPAHARIALWPGGGGAGLRFGVRKCYERWGLSVESAVSFPYREVFSAVESSLVEYAARQRPVGEIRAALAPFKAFQQQYSDDEFFDKLLLIVFCCGFRAATVTERLGVIRAHFPSWRSVATYGTQDERRVLGDTRRMIRNERKVRAVAANAKTFAGLVSKFGSFQEYVYSFRPSESFEYLLVPPHKGLGIYCLFKPETTHRTPIAMDGVSPAKSEWLTHKALVDTTLHNAGWCVPPYIEGTALVAMDRCAVEEYPTANGPADYALVLGGRIVGIVEAKKLSLAPQNVLKAKRYSRGLHQPGVDYGGFGASFLYSKNGEVTWYHDSQEVRTQIGL